MDINKDSIIQIFMTTLWNESLYKAWSVILQNILPDIKLLNLSLKKLSELVDCDIIYLMEKFTLLKIGAFCKDESKSEH